MGTTLGYICEKCGYEFTSSYGIGFMFPAFYRKTVDEMKIGKYMSGPRLAMFTPKIGYKHTTPTGA